MDALIRLDDVTKDYNSGGRAALDSVRFEVAAGEAVAVMGPSGSGKSTLLNLVAGVVIAVAGGMLPASWAAGSRTATALRAE